MNKLPEKEIGYSFSHPILLQQALTHSSYAHEHNQSESTEQDHNERLEFLGDAVLELSVSDLLYHRYPHLPEGELTKKRAALVCEPSLAALARDLKIGTFLKLGHGEQLSGGQNRDSLLSDAMEAIFGAVYLDGGFEKAKALIQCLFEPIMENLMQTIDPKTDFQELIQRYSREPIIYTIISEDGPAHQREFTATVSHEDKEMGRGTGRSKKEAEQSAALEAIKKLQN